MDRATPDEPYDLVLVGGGLQNGLVALCALHADAGCRIALVEAERRLGGNHTWCVHARDVPDSARPWFEPLVVERWAGYDVVFPDQQRTLSSAYAYVSSERFAAVVSAAFARSRGCQLITGRRAVAVGAQAVRLDDAQVLHGRLVVDARGPEPFAYAGRCGYQKFVGLEIELAGAHGLTRPIMMDARCPQRDGYRFFYVLPLTARSLLVEETRFSLSSGLDVPRGRAAVRSYAARFGAISRVLREEVGVLPMPWSVSFAPPAPDAALPAGYRGGYFHPATGYSLPAALRFAERLGALRAHGPQTPAWECFLREHRSQATFALHLNRLLFTGFAETDMWGVLSRFYRLSEPLIERFYAMSSTLADRARIMIGRPPRGFSLTRALSAARGAV